MTNEIAPIAIAILEQLSAGGRGKLEAAGCLISGIGSQENPHYSIEMFPCGAAAPRGELKVVATDLGIGIRLRSEPKFFGERDLNSRELAALAAGWKARAGR